MSLYDASVPQFARILKNIDKWLDKAEAHAKAKNFDPALYLSLRLAPDQFPFLKQIHIATDQVRNGLARVTGKEAPAALSDGEKTLADVRDRLQKTIAYLETYSPKDFQALESRKVQQPNQPGKVALAADHLHEHVTPTFYFHVVTAYSILRHNGVDVGKGDYHGQRKIVEGQPS